MFQTLDCSSISQLQINWMFLDLFPTHTPFSPSSKEAATFAIQLPTWAPILPTFSIWSINGLEAACQLSHLELTPLHPAHLQNDSLQALFDFSLPDFTPELLSRSGINCDQKGYINLLMKERGKKNKKPASSSLIAFLSRVSLWDFYLSPSSHLNRFHVTSQSHVMGSWKLTWCRPPHRLQRALGQPISQGRLLN